MHRQAITQIKGLWWYIHIYVLRWLFYKSLCARSKALFSVKFLLKAFLSLAAFVWHLSCCHTKHTRTTHFIRNNTCTLLCSEVWLLSVLSPRHNQCLFLSLSLSAFSWFQLIKVLWIVNLFTWCATFIHSISSALILLKFTNTMLAFKRVAFIN